MTNIDFITARAISDFEDMLTRDYTDMDRATDVIELLKAILPDNLPIGGSAGRKFRNWESLKAMLAKKEDDTRKKFREALHRFFMAMVGGLLLVIPVVIMSFKTSRTRSLVTLSVSVIVFAVVITVGASTAKPQDIVAATAAYTAVLAVFLGASGSSGANSS